MPHTLRASDKFTPREKQVVEIYVAHIRPMARPLAAWAIRLKEDTILELIEETPKVSRNRVNIMRYLAELYVNRADFAISVWGRCSKVKGSCSLKACSKSFSGYYLDMPQPHCMTYTELSMPPEAPSITDPKVKADMLATRDALYSFAEAMFKDRAQQGLGVVATMTTSGRLHYSFLHVVCLRHTHDLPYEYVAAMMNPIEADGMTVTFKRSTPAMDMTLHEAMQRKPKKRAKEKPIAAQVPRHTKQWCIGSIEVSKPSMHVCGRCGTTNSVLMRPGPAGPSSLCNNCGIKYARNGPAQEVEYDFAQEEDDSPSIPWCPSAAASPLAESPPLVAPEADNASSNEWYPLFGGLSSILPPDEPLD